MVLRLSRKQKVLGSIPSVAFLHFLLFLFLFLLCSALMLSSTPEKERCCVSGGIQVLFPEKYLKWDEVESRIKADSIVISVPILQSCASLFTSNLHSFSNSVIQRFS